MTRARTEQLWGRVPGLGDVLIILGSKPARARQASIVAGLEDEWIRVTPVGGGPSRYVRTAALVALWRERSV